MRAGMSADEIESLIIPRGTAPAETAPAETAPEETAPAETSAEETPPRESDNQGHWSEIIDSISALANELKELKAATQTANLNSARMPSTGFKSESTAADAIAKMINGGR